MATSAERQRRFKEQMQAQGFVQVSGWVPAHAVAEVNDLLAKLRVAPHLTAGPARDPQSGRLVRVKQ